LTERRLVDGLIIAETQQVDPRIDYLIETGRAFVAFGRSLSGGDHPWVDPDFANAVESSIETLTRLGHRRIALALPVGEANYLHIMLDAYDSAMRRRGLVWASEFVQRRAPGEAGGYAAGGAFLAMEPRPTAILISDTMQAVGLYKKLNDSGLRPGRDISIIGILLEGSAQILSPALTTFQTDWTAIGSRLGEALVSAMSRPAALRHERKARSSGDPHTASAIQRVMPVTLRPGQSLHQVDAPLRSP
jgi:DNA-binding LacI/PurR family transcriptional regulator